MCFHTVAETKDQDQVLQLEIEMTEDPKKNLQGEKRITFHRGLRFG